MPWAFAQAEKLRDVEQLKLLLSIYERKYGSDINTMRQDILELREPVFAVRPTVAFGLDEEVVWRTPRAGDLRRREYAFYFGGGKRERISSSKMGTVLRMY